MIKNIIDKSAQTESSSGVVRVKIRDSNIELLRIICMFMIIMHHCVVHGGSFNMDDGTNKWIALFFVPGGKIAFDCFLAISAWYLVNQKFRMERFLKVWTEVLFYSVAFSIIAYIMGTPFNIRNWFSILFPIAGNSHGFAASYLMFYLLTPFLYKMTQGLNQKQSKWLLILIFYAEVMTQMIGNISQYSQPMFSELLLFILCYIAAFYYKNWPIRIMKSKLKPFLIFTIIWIVRYIVWIFYIKYPENQILIYLYVISGDESSIFNLVAGFCLFFAFKNIKVKNSKFINKIAQTTFGILLIHDHNFFRYVLWKDIVHAQDWYYVTDFVVRIIAISFIIFIICSVIDYIRANLLEKPIMRNKKIQDICFSVNQMIYKT